MLDKFPSMKFVTLTSPKGGWLKSLEGKRVQGVSGRHPLGSLGSLVQSPQENTQQDGGRGGEGNGRQGLERQLGS